MLGDYRKGFYLFIDKCNLSLHLRDFSNIVSLYFIIITLIVDDITWLLVLFCGSLIVSLDVKWHFLLFLLRILP